MPLCVYSSETRQVFSTESGRRDVLAAPQRSACVWPPQKCSSWSPVPGQRCARAAVGWWAGWRSWIWPPWPRTQPMEAFLSASPPPYNQGSFKRNAWLIFFFVCVKLPLGHITSWNKYHLLCLGCLTLKLEECFECKLSYSLAGFRGPPLPGGEVQALLGALLPLQPGLRTWNIPTSVMTCLTGLQPITSLVLVGHHPIRLHKGMLSALCVWGCGRNWVAYLIKKVFLWEHRYSATLSVWLIFFSHLHVSAPQRLVTLDPNQNDLFSAHVPNLCSYFKLNYFYWEMIKSTLVCRCFSFTSNCCTSNVKSRDVCVCVCVCACFIPEITRALAALCISKSAHTGFKLVMLQSIISIWKP